MRKIRTLVSLVGPIVVFLAGCLNMRVVNEETSNNWIRLEITTPTFIAEMPTSITTKEFGDTPLVRPLPSKINVSTPSNLDTTALSLSGELQITSITPTIERIEQLTFGIGHNHSPSFSTDGSKIVFISTRDGNQEIYLMNLDGSEQIRLTNTPDIIEDLPSFTLDGTKIIFGGSKNNSSDIYLMNLDGSNLVNLTKTPFISEGRPKFIPSIFVTQKLIFDSDRTGNYEIYWAYFESGELRDVQRITTSSNLSSRLPSFIDPIEKILFRATDGRNNSRIYTIGLDGNNLQEISRGLSDGENDYFPVVSSDGNWIIFVSDRDGNYEIYSMPIEGTDFTRLTNHPAEDNTPAISPDNEWLVFASKREGQNLQLFKMPFLK